MFFTSIFCGSAVHILKDLIADGLMQSADRRDLIRGFVAPQGQDSYLVFRHSRLRLFRFKHILLLDLSVRS
jgi:hypothetical protein